MGSDEIKRLAIIAAGTKRTSKKRTVNILKVANELKELHSVHGSLDAVSKIAKLSPEMVRQFIRLLSLTDRVKALIRKGLIDSVDIGYRISKLGKRDQIVLADNVIGRKLGSEDVRNIVKHKIDHPSISISKAIKDVMDSRVRKIFVAYLGIDEDKNHCIDQECGKRSKAVLIKSLFQTLVGKENIVFFSLNGRVVIIKVSQEGLRRMKDKAKQWKTSLRNIANVLVSEYLEKCK